MRRKTSVPEIHESSMSSSQGESFMQQQQTVQDNEEMRMDTNDDNFQHRNDLREASQGEGTNNGTTHQSNNSTDTTHSCMECGIDFPSLASLQKHEFLDHSNWDNNEDEDDEEEEPINTKNHRKHPAADTNGHSVATTMVKTEPNQYEPKNNSTTPTNIEQNKHAMSIFTCQLCGAAFFDKPSLEQHNITHTKASTTTTPKTTQPPAPATRDLTPKRSDSPYDAPLKNCKYCGEGFMSQAALAQHEHAHELVTKDVGNQQQMYKCRHCEQKFDKFCDMMQHERTHVGEDMFQWQLDSQNVKRARGRPPKAGRKPNWQLYAEIDSMPPSSPSSPRRGRRPKVRKYTKHNRPGSHIKRAKTAYFYFLEEFRKQYRTEAGWNCKASEITKACGVKWNSMLDGERRPYTEAASIDRQRYEAQIAVYKKERDPEKPKKPPTAFFFFLTDFRAQMAGQKIETGRRLTEICGEQWNKLTDEQKSPYMNIYAAEVKKYQDAMEEYKSRKATENVVQAQWRGPGRPPKELTPIAPIALPAM